MLGDPLKGKKQVILIVSVLLGVCALVIVFFNLIRGDERLPAQIIRFCLTAILCLFLYLGYRWARWLSGILFSLGMIVGLIAGIGFILKGNIMGAFVLLLPAIAYGFCVSQLFFSKISQRFFRVRANKRMVRFASQPWGKPTFPAAFAASKAASPFCTHKN